MEVKAWLLPALFSAGTAAVTWYLASLGKTPVSSSKGTPEAVSASAPPPPAAEQEGLDRPLTLRELESDSDTVPVDVELKMVFAVRSDLGMSKGKTAAQVGHAVLGCWLEAQRSHKWRQWCLAWNFRAAAKITLKVEDEAELDRVAAAARAAGLPFIVIEDAGRTEIPAGSRTVCGIGPAPKGDIDRITGPKGAIPLRLLT